VVELPSANERERQPSRRVGVAASRRLEAANGANSCRYFPPIIKITLGHELVRSGDGGHSGNDR
jgi:hypothetical protein